MECPPRRVPPPPSIPPPRNISRSGRVPPPKGAPPGGVRRARQPSRRVLNPQAVENRTVADQQDDDQGVNRNTNHDGNAPLSDEEGLSEGSSRESFEESVDSGHGRDSRPLPAVRRRRHRHSPHTSGVSPRIRTEESSEDTESSRGERRRRRAPSHKRDTNRDKITPGSDNSSSVGSDDNAPDDKADRGDDWKEGDDSSREGRGAKDRGWNRHSPRRLSGGVPPEIGDRQLSDTTSDSGGEEGNRKWRVTKYKSEKQHREQRRARNAHSKSPKRRAETRKDASSRTDSYSDANEEDERRTEHLQGKKLQSYTTNPERRGSGKGEGNMIKRGPHRRRRRTELDDSEAEGYGWSGNKYSWDSADAASTGNISDRHVKSGQTPNSRVDDVPSDDGDENAACGDKNNATGTQRSPAEPVHANVKELDNSEAWGSDREQPTGSQHDETLGGSGSSCTPRHSSGAELAGSPVAKAASGAVTTVGKPIRGARWGEAIGVRSRVFDTSTIPTKRVDLKKFVSCPLQSGPGTVLRCFIERDRSGTHKFSNMFSMYADLEDGSGRMLLAARKLLASKTAYYIICVRQEDLFRESGKRGGNSFLAKLRASRVAHTEYALYDRGDNPAAAAAEGNLDVSAEAKRKSVRNPIELAKSKALRQHEKHEQGELRRELGVIVFNFDKKEQRTGKRRMEVAIPQLRQEGDFWEPVSWQPSDAKESMINNFGRIRYQGAQNFLQDDRLLVYHQRESRYDPLSSCLVDYRGRATAPSVKNFQLLKSPPEDNVKRARYFTEGGGKDDTESDDLPRPVFLQMGKVGKDCFNVDLEWPLSILQAFAICLSRFDTQAQF